MELEGLGCSLVGRAMYVFCNDKNRWIPWEFLRGTGSHTYACTILVSGPGVDSLELDHDWTFVIRPGSGGKEWSCLATILKGIGSTSLIVFGVGAPSAPAAFLTFMDNMYAENRHRLTRVWLGEHIEIPTIPDAIFFPPGVAADTMYAMIHRLPGRSGHEGFHIQNESWYSIVKATEEQGLGLVVTDVEEPRWSLFWHKLEDSDTDTTSGRLRKGLRLVQLGSALLESLTAKGGRITDQERKI